MLRSYVSKCPTKSPSCKSSFISIIPSLRFSDGPKVFFQSSRVPWSSGQQNSETNLKLSVRVLLSRPPGEPRGLNKIPLRIHDAKGYTLALKSSCPHKLAQRKSWATPPSEHKQMCSLSHDRIVQQVVRLVRRLQQRLRFCFAEHPVLPYPLLALMLVLHLADTDLHNDKASYVLFLFSSPFSCFATA